MRRFEILWCATIVAFLGALFVYQGTPGRPAEAPAQWPGRLRRSARNTVIMFAHPKCPCTRASLTQFERLLRESNPVPRAYVVFIDPASAGPDFHLTDLWRASQSLDGVTTVADHGGNIAQAFGVHTSGQILLYGPKGNLAFAGGITPFRGHEGDSQGLDGLTRALVASNANPEPPVAVYGCPLFAEGEQSCHP